MQLVSQDGGFARQTLLQRRKICSINRDSHCEGPPSGRGKLQRVLVFCRAACNSAQKSWRSRRARRGWQALCQGAAVPSGTAVFESLLFTYFPYVAALARIKRNTNPKILGHAEASKRANPELLFSLLLGNVDLTSQKCIHEWGLAGEARAPQPSSPGLSQSLSIITR